MGYEREFPASAKATAVFVGSGPGQPLLALPSNAQRAEAKLQGADAFWLGVTPSFTASSALFYPSGAIHDDLFHVGAFYVQSAAANGATMAIRTWESSM